MNNITIAGQNIELLPLNGQEQKRLWLEVIANFEVSEFKFNGRRQLLFVPKSNIKYAPIHLKKLSERATSALDISAVFYYDRLLTYERDRLVEQGVYFVVADKYAFVPTLIINRKESDTGIKEIFSPATQYILLFHLQSESISGKRIKDLESLVPYKYKTIAKSIGQLQQHGILSLDGGKEKTIIIKRGGKELWNMSQTFLASPIKSVHYSSQPFVGGEIAGLSALSHYSMLAPEDVSTRAITTVQYTELKEKGHQFLPFEDKQRIEVWKYPPLGNDGYVDKLSLYLTLKDDKDPRVEKELETMINEMPW